MFWLSTSGHATEIVRWSVWTRRQNNCLPTHGFRSRMKPGQPERRDYEYERNGTANLFMMFAPLEGWRRVKVTDRRTAVDYAKALEDLSDRHFPNAKKIVLVQDNLNTHKPASLYEAFPPDKARRLVSVLIVQSSFPSGRGKPARRSNRAPEHALKLAFPGRDFGAWVSATATRRQLRDREGMRLDALESGSNGITRQSTAVGSIWQNPNSPFSRRNVSTAASLTSRSSSNKSPLRRLIAMSITPKPTGSSRPMPPASNSSIYTRLFR